MKANGSLQTSLLNDITAKCPTVQATVAFLFFQRRQIQSAWQVTYGFSPVNSFSLGFPL
jgi:hypothetical protein